MKIIFVEKLEKGLNIIQRVEIDIMYLVIIFESLLVDIKVVIIVFVLSRWSTFFFSDSIVNNFVV